MTLHSKIPFIPKTMATQHPDNVSVPYWNQQAFVSTSQEVAECFHCLSDLSCDEYMWDWEGKFVDEAVVDRLYSKYLAYFSGNPLGKKKFLTFRVPNISKEGPSRLSRAFSGILSASYTAESMGLNSPPIFEVIHPMTQKASELILLQKKFMETAKFQAKIFGVKSLKPSLLSLIPLIEGTDTLLKSRKILEQYVAFLIKLNGKKPSHLRPFIARSDPALDGGYLAAILSAKAAMSEYFRFEAAHKIPVYPMIGTGSLPFRGGLNPRRIDKFLNLYPGLATVTLQSAFRYDYPFSEVKLAIEELNKKLPCPQRPILSDAQMQALHEMDLKSVQNYRSVIEKLGDLINGFAQLIPARRERIQHTGHFGYSRSLGDSKLKLPRAITFTAVFYSMGIPPELIGLGRSLHQFHHAKKRPELLKHLENLIPNFKERLKEIGVYFNSENLELLSSKFPVFKLIKEDVEKVEDYLGCPLGPKDYEHFLHRNTTNNILRGYLKLLEKPKADLSLEEDILRSAELRRSLG